MLVVEDNNCVNREEKCCNDSVEKDIKKKSKRHDEYHYLDLIEHVISHGNKKGDRTGMKKKILPKLIHKKIYDKMVCLVSTVL